MKSNAFLHTAAFFLLLLFLNHSAFGACPTVGPRFLQGTGFGTGSDAASGNDVCSYGGGISIFTGEILTINGDLTINGNFTIYGTLVLNGTLTVDGDLTIDGVGEFQINSGATLDVTDDIHNGGFFSAIIGPAATDGTVEGVILVGGDFDNNDDGNISIGPGGIVDVAGDYNNNNGSTTNVEDGGTLNSSNINENGGTLNTVNDPSVDCTDGCCGAQCGTLPVELISFDASAISDRRAELSWSTATEINNEGFYVQKAPVGTVLNWEDIQFIEGNGNKETVSFYSCIDDGFSQNAYYRLKQVDFDGQYEYHDMIYLEYPFSADVKIYPNPFTDQLNIQIDEGVYNVRISDTKGSTFYLFESSHTHINKEVNKITSGLENGNYLLIIQKESESFTTQIVKRAVNN